MDEVKRERWIANRLQPIWWQVERGGRTKQSANGRHFKWYFVYATSHFLSTGSGGWAVGDGAWEARQEPGQRRGGTQEEQDSAGHTGDHQAPVRYAFRYSNVAKVLVHLRVHVLVCVHVNDKSGSLSVYILRPCSCSCSCMNIPMLKF